MSKIYNNMIKSMAIGDSNGFPYENMNKKLISQINPEVSTTIIKGNLLKDSTITDDTEHMVLTYLSLTSEKNISYLSFARELEQQLKSWYSTFPAGIGKATLNACFNLKFLKKNYTNSGYLSAGNGPLMRAPIIAAFYHDNEVERQKYIHVSTIMTHTDPLAELAAQSVGDIVSLFIKDKEIIKDKNRLLSSIIIILNEVLNKVSVDSKSLNIWNQLLREINTLSTFSYDKFIDQNFQQGVSGFSLDTLKMAIFQFYYFNDLKTIIHNCVMAGGDTDSNAGIIASIYSVLEDDVNIGHDIDIESVFKVIKGPYSYRIRYSAIQWIKSFYSLWRFVYSFKK